MAYFFFSLCRKTHWILFIFSCLVKKVGELPRLVLGTRQNEIRWI